MQGYFSLGLFDSFEQLLDIFVLVQHWFVVAVYPFLEVDEVQFELSEIEGGEGVHNFFVKFGDGLVL